MTGDVAGLRPPVTRADAVLAAGCLELVDAHLVGLIDGHHGIDIDRCREILIEADARGISITPTDAHESSIKLLDVLAARDIAQEATSV